MICRPGLANYTVRANKRNHYVEIHDVLFTFFHWLVYVLKQRANRYVDFRTMEICAFHCLVYVLKQHANRCGFLICTARDCLMLMSSRRRSVPFWACEQQAALGGQIRRQQFFDPNDVERTKENNLLASRCSQQCDVAWCRNHNFWKKRLLLTAGGSDFKFTHCRENSYVVFCRIALRTRPKHYVKSAFQCLSHGCMFFLTCGHSSRTLKGGSRIMIWVCSNAT